MRQHRSITPAEVDVVRAALTAAPVARVDPEVFAALPSLAVVGRCACGCDSVDFATPGTTARDTILADGIATTPAGGEVGVLVWARDGHVSALEIYDLGAGDDDLRLPLPGTIRPG